MLPFTEKELADVEPQMIRTNEFSNGGIYFLINTLWNNIFIIQNVKTKTRNLVEMKISESGEYLYYKIYSINQYIKQNNQDDTSKRTTNRK